MSKLIARLLADKLIEIYTKRKLPDYAKRYAAYPESFTKERIRSDPRNSLFQMIVLAAYDRTPFTRWAGGSEPIAGLDPSKASLPSILRSAQLFTVADILGQEEDAIDEILKRCSFCGHHIASYSKVRYAQTFRRAAKAIDSLLSDIRSARTASHVAALHEKLDEIPGIGPAIASKLIMYTLRESPYFGSSIHPRELYPAAKPLEKEYHVGNIANVLKRRYGQNIIDDIVEQLRQLGDPFAIDALFYIGREAPHFSKRLFNLQTSEAHNKEGQMSTDNKKPLMIHLPAHKREQFERLAEDEFGIDASTLAQIWILERMKQWCVDYHSQPTELEYIASKLAPSSGNIVRLRGILDNDKLLNRPLGLRMNKTESEKLPWKQSPVKIKLVINGNVHPAMLRMYTGVDKFKSEGSYIRQHNRFDNDLNTLGLKRLDRVRLEADGARNTITIIGKD